MYHYLDYSMDTKVLYKTKIGSEVSVFAKEHFVDIISKSSEFKNGDYSAALTYSFLRIDELLNTPEGQKELFDISTRCSKTFCEQRSKEKIASNVGCTACILLIAGDDIYIANVGDTCCVICKDGVPTTLTKFHKPEIEEEKNRIIEAGGSIDEGKINGEISISRSLGDLEYKNNIKLNADKQIIIANPDIVIEKIDEKTEFIVISCNGVWKCYKDDELIQELRNRIWDKAKNKPYRVKLSKVISEAFDSIVATDLENDGIFKKHIDGIGCDNMGCIIIQLKKQMNS